MGWLLSLHLAEQEGRGVDEDCIRRVRLLMASWKVVG